MVRVPQCGQIPAADPRRQRIPYTAPSLTPVTATPSVRWGIVRRGREDGRADLLLNSKKSGLLVNTSLYQSCPYVAQKVTIFSKIVAFATPNHGSLFCHFRKAVACQNQPLKAFFVIDEASILQRLIAEPE